MSILSKIFNNNEVKRTKVVCDPIETNYSFMSSDDYKEELENFILILQQIQDLNNLSAKGKGNVMHLYLTKKHSINNATELAIEKYSKKIEEIENTTKPISSKTNNT